VIRRWLLESLTHEIPGKGVAYCLLVLASLCGGYGFAITGSWIKAIALMGFAYALLWYVFRPLAEWIGESIVKALLWFLPLYTYGNKL
jgi:hypothetical protein